MSRPLRLEFAGALYHITSRGNEKKAIYLEDADFELFLSLMADVCQRFNWVIHSYCLMTHHYHLVVETPDGNLSLGMCHLNGVYTQRFNSKNKRVGHFCLIKFHKVPRHCLSLHEPVHPKLYLCIGLIYNWLVVKHSPQFIFIPVIVNSLV